MAKVEIIENLDDKVFEIFQEYQLKTTNSIFASKFPNTYFLVTMYDISNNFIKNSILDCVDTDNLFGIKIMFRAQIEHLLRFKYIFINWIMTKSDDPAGKYLAYSDAREELDKLRASIDEEKLFDPDFKVDSWQEILDKHPVLKDFTKREIEDESKKFTYKNIIRFLKEELRIEDKSNFTFFGSLIREYSKLSSFVHGGTDAHIESLNLFDELEREKEYCRIASLSFQMSTTIKLFTLLLLVQTDPKQFNSYYLRVDQVLNKFNEIESNTKKPKSDIQS